MALLKLTVAEYSATALKITVTNDSGALLNKSVMIELFPPTYLVDDRIKKAADDGMTDRVKSGLGGIVTGPAGWSFWAKPGSTVETLMIEIDNDVNQATDEEKPPVEIAAGTSFVITVPLKAQAARQDIKLAYKYKYDNTQSFEGELELKSDSSGGQPEVTLEAVDPNPLAITPGKSVPIKWAIKDGVSASLYGPLPGGNSVLPLSSNPADTYKISGGTITVIAAGRMSYLLLATVKGSGTQMVQVARTLTLETLNSDKYLYVNTRPNKVLPYGRVFIDWAAWGFTPVQIDVGSRENYIIRLPGRVPEGSGFIPVNASGTISDEKVIITTQSISLKKTTEITMTSWLPVTSSGVSGQPLGMAVVAPKLAVLTTEGVFIADVGLSDSRSSTNLTFTKGATTAPKQWLGLTGLDTRFIALRRTSKDELEVVPYKLDGSADMVPAVTLPADLRLLVAAPGTVFDVVGFRGRAYVVVETPLSTGTLRRAFSVGFGATTAEQRTEPLLETLVGYKLVVFNNALFALNRKTGRMLRFNLSTTGTLEEPLKAASAVTNSSGAEQSMINEGLIVPVGEVLAVLGPNAIPSLEEIEKYEPRKVIVPTRKMLQAVDPSGNPQDIFYNPQKDYWGRCGHGIDVKPGALAAFRSGDSQRLWLIQPDGKMHTLSVGLESLFAHDFLPGALPWPLTPYFKKRQLTLENWCGPLQPMNSVPPGPIAHQARVKFDLYYNDAEPVQLRFLLERTKGVKHDFWLELTFYGPDLSRTRHVFQRVETDGQGQISLAEVPNSTSEQATDVGLHPAIPVPLIEGVRLQIFNFTSYKFFQQAPEASDAEVKRYDGNILRIAYNTPNFLVFAEGAGELHFSVDYGLPTGIEISPGSQKQSKLIRINTDASKGLYPELLPLTEGAPFQLKITYRHKKVVEGVYVGDGVGTEDGASLFLPVANTRDQSQLQVWKINPENLSHIASGNLPNGLGVFAPSNRLALASEYVYAMIENDIHVFDYSLQKRGQSNLNNFFTFVNDVDGFTYSTDCYLLGMKQDRPIDTSKPIWFHFLHGVGVMNKDASGKVSLLTVSDTSLDSVRAVPNPVRGAPTWVSSATLSPMAVSPVRPTTGARRVAVCIQGGIFVSDPAIRPVPVAAAGREEDIMFGNSGRTLYCLHTRADNQGLLLSRIMVDTWQVQSLSLPRGEGPYDLAAGSQQVFPPFPNKNQRASSVARTPEENLLFVSHGKSIFKIDNGPTMVVRETFNMELPCRIFHVVKAKPTIQAAPCNVVYALGATYRGDGRSGSGVTHLYKLGTLDK